MTAQRLPRSVEELRELMSQFRTEESERQAATIDVRPDDVFISTYSKSGTTWLQQVVHQLRSGGSMDFDEISAAVPWLDVAYDIGIDPLDQPWAPRAFKLHRPWDDVPTGGKVITAFRSPEGVLRSFYRFYSGSFFEAGAVSIEEFTHGWFLEGSTSGLYFDFLVSFHRRLGGDNLLAFAYEDMLEAPETLVRVVADFIGVGTDPESIAAAIRNSSRDVMAANVEKFDAHLLSDSMSRRTGYPIGKLDKVHAASPDFIITDEIRTAIAAKWREIVTPSLGFEDYAAFRASLPDLLGVRS
jgi:hypothetical protein